MQALRAQLNSLLWCCHGDSNGWSEEVGEKPGYSHRGNCSSKNS